MLRILVISLCVANLLLFGFQRSIPVTEPEKATTQTVNKRSRYPTIHLFSEMVQDQGLLTGSRQCFSLGPFHSSDDMAEVRGSLQEVTVSISERETQALVEKGYWVFMPPYISLLEANQELFSLQALGLQDIGIIYEGEWQNAISLGYFLRQEYAQRRKTGLEERGYAPLIRVQRQAEARFWLDYEQIPGSDLIALDLQGRPNDFMQRSLPCPEQQLFDVPVEEVQVAAAESEQIQAAEEPVELTTDQVPVTGPAQDTENLPDDSLTTETSDGLETLPDNSEDTAVDDNDDPGSDSIIETEPETEEETETGVG